MLVSRNLSQKMSSGFTQSMGDRMFEDFEGITNNEAYKRVFVDRMMLPHPTEAGRFLGNTQREDFLPYLLPLVDGLPQDAQIFDFGCGGGEIVDIALQRAKAATVHLEEPNTLLLESYRRRLGRYPQLREGAVFDCPIEDLYHPHDRYASQRPRPGSQDLILDLHMIYHITRFKDDSIDASVDIIDMLTFQYQLLKPGGRIFLVYADDERCTTAHVSRFFFQREGREHLMQNLDSIREARSGLLKNGGIVGVLRELYPEFEPRLTVHQTESWVFGHSKRDMAILCLLAELGDSDQAPFDVKKLEICAEFIATEAAAIRLSQETRDIAQKGMWRFFQPQVILILEKL